MKKLIFFMLILTFSQIGYGAYIHGSIYDLTLSKIDNVVVEIDTIPRQRFVSLNGTYGFEVQRGYYTITTRHLSDNLDMYASENITISDDGNYVIDLFLYPNDGDDEDLVYEDFEADMIESYNEKQGFVGFPIVIGIVAIIGLMTYLVSTRPKEKKKIENVSVDLKRLISLLEKNHGRMTQKEIRREFAMSEAKISLIVAELESLGKVKKIKQGRGNIIILQ